jgi:hypothetical protein
LWRPCFALAQRQPDALMTVTDAAIFVGRDYCWCQERHLIHNLGH